MLKTEQRGVTASDFRALPQGPPYYQLIQGELIMSPSPNRYHQEISQNLEFILLQYLEQHPIGRLYHAPLDVYLTDENVFSPDIIFVTSEHAHILTDYVEGAPDLIVEILSPSTARYDREEKRKIYAAQGVNEYWLIFPKAPKVEVFYLGQNSETPAATYGKADTLTSPLFPGLTLKAREIFKR